jgi:ribosomal protein S6
VKRYEGLFILNTTGREDGVKEAIDKIGSEIAAIGGKVETVQKMDKRPFSRITDKKHTGGFYVNLIFELEPGKLDQLRHRFVLSEEIYRVLFSVAPAPKAVVQQ